VDIEIRNYSPSVEVLISVTSLFFICCIMLLLGFAPTIQVVIIIQRIKVFLTLIYSLITYKQPELSYYFIRKSFFHCLLLIILQIITYATV
jgi:hypothetical protein